ncbi:hypothetical protein BC828DRAFT_393284 [Blastocladiella britannica]|nr:hypothetical protein BC828DRAFT_393284 [Blastocladiella britannica]
MHSITLTTVLLVLSCAVAGISAQDSVVIPGSVASAPTDGILCGRHRDGSSLDHGLFNCLTDVANSVTTKCGVNGQTPAFYTCMCTNSAAAVACYSGCTSDAAVSQRGVAIAQQSAWCGAAGGSTSQGLSGWDNKAPVDSGSSSPSTSSTSSSTSVPSYGTPTTTNPTSWSNPGSGTKTSSSTAVTAAKESGAAAKNDSPASKDRRYNAIAGGVAAVAAAAVFI